MLPRGIPETTDEALEVATKIAAQTPNDPQPSHWPHSQVVAVAQIAVAQQKQIDELYERTEALKKKLVELTAEPTQKRPGRPRTVKPATADGSTETPSDDE